MASDEVRLEELATEKTLTRQIMHKCSEMLQDCNWAAREEVEKLQLSILGRLTSGYTETILADVLVFFDLHTI